MRLLSPDPAEGSGSTPPEEVASPPPVAAAAPPPAAAAVLAGEVTEDTAQLKQELEKERGLRKQREIECADLQDKYHQLKTAVPIKQVKPAPWTFWEND
jgi:hypothetical protein